jgi:single-strand DNA-binding protein
MANLNFNKVIIGGRLTSDVQLKTTPSGVSITSFSVAVNRRGKSGDEAKADFISVVAWRGTAEFICKYFKKGSSLCIVGSLQNRTWTDQQGARHYATDVVADEAMFVDGKNDAQGNNAPAKQNGSQEKFDTSKAIFTEMPQDQDLPF